MKRMKKVLSLALAGTLLLSLAACGNGGTAESGAPEGIYTPGTYEGAAQGFGGEVTAKVTVDANAITDVVLTGD